MLRFIALIRSIGMMDIILLQSAYTEHCGLLGNKMPTIREIITEQAREELEKLKSKLKKREDGKKTNKGDL